MVSEIVKDVAVGAVKESAKAVWEKGVDVFTSSVISGAVIGVGILGFTAGMEGVKTAVSGATMFVKNIFKSGPKNQANSNPARGEINIDQKPESEKPSGK